MSNSKQHKNPVEKGRNLARAARKAFKSSQESPAEAGSDENWSQWVAYLRKRSEPKPLAKMLGVRRGHPVHWSLPPAATCGRAAELLDVFLSTPLEDNAIGCLENWQTEATSEPIEAGRAFEFLAVAHALPALAEKLPAEKWWPLLDLLCDTTDEAENLSLESDALTAELLAVELPLTLAYLLQEVKRCRKLATAAATRLKADILELLDGEGIVRGGDLPQARELLATWTRSRTLCEALGSKLFRGDAREQYDWLVRQCVRMTRFDGSATLSSPSATGASEPFPRDLFVAALTLAKDDDDWLAARWALPSFVAPNSAERNGSLPEATVHSEWAEMACMRSDWSRRSAKLTTTYANKSLLVELENAGQLVLSGAWNPEVTFNGQPLGPLGDWEEVGWASDQDGDYLELEVSLENRCRVQRQFFLSRDDRFLFMADAVLADETGQLEYICRVPLVDSCTFQPAEESREGQLCGKRPSARVLPLALPEWRRATGLGELTGGSGLQLQMSAEAQRLYAPLFFDLDPRRLKKECTWRTLTVAEGLVIQPHEAAVGYRVQIGRRQWMFYRSLAPRGNRTLLGQNTTADFLLARFEVTGEIETLVELE